jgi:hypothetical protein
MAGLAPAIRASPVGQPFGEGYDGTTGRCITDEVRMAGSSPAMTESI